MLHTRTTYTATDYEKLPEGAPYQLIGGDLVMSPSPSFEHQNVALNLATILRQFVRQHGLGTVVIAPMDVYFGPADVFQPDIIYFNTEKRRQLDRLGRIRFVPDLVVEILSPGTEGYDYSRKKKVYGESGVAEYWIIDPEERTLEVMLNEGGLYRTVAYYNFNDTVESPSLPGLRFGFSELFEI